MRVLTGLATSRGLVSGPVFLIRGDGEHPVPEYLVEEGREGDELLRFRRAVVETKRDLDSLVAVLRERAGREDVRVFESHLMMLEDPFLVQQAEDLILKERLNVEAAVKAVAVKARAQFERMNDPYFRERVRDFDDVERRLQKALAGFAPDPRLELKVPSIVVADDLTPSETVQLPREKVLGFATNGGSPTSHVALLARALGIPAVTGLGSVTACARPGTTILLDGTSGTVTVDPDAAAVLQFEAQARRQQDDDRRVACGVPAGTLADGSEIAICANVHPGLPLDDLKTRGARGVGLYRSEYLWLSRDGEPSEEVQFAAYRALAEQVSLLSPTASATIRTLDIGGDKTVVGISAKESNPFLGNRSIRYLLSNPDVFRTQLRAILRASAYGRLKIMHPMVSCVEELTAAAVILEGVKRALDADGVAYDRTIPVGAMIEVPSAALLSPQLAQAVDFLSIGTNDLVQYTMAIDRGNEMVAHLYQPTNPAIIELVCRTIDAGHRCGIPVSVCGESASDPVIGVIWAALGADVLSMSATYIPVMAKLLCRLTRSDLSECAALVTASTPQTTARAVLESAQAWLRGKIPDLDDLLK
jgi:phosphotransferase system enzyme I (PtsI)